MMKFSLSSNEYLNTQVNAFFNCDYTRYQAANNPDFIVELKNNFHQFSDQQLSQAQHALKQLLLSDLPKAAKNMQWETATVCVMPRSKVISYYSPNQQGFVNTVKSALTELAQFEDGTDYLIRRLSTRTTHLPTSNGGSNPYKGITRDTCYISDDVIGKRIILVDDIYTRSVNVDEDAIQALLDKGASEVCLYTVGRTVFRKRPEMAQLVA